ncbi:thioredoxin family protein [Chloroflexota bacterium]
MRIVSGIQKYLLAWVMLSICLLLMASCTASPASPSSPNGEELVTYQMEIDLLGAKHETSVDSQGRLETSVQAASADDSISLSIDKDTILLDKDEKPLQFIQAVIDPNPPLPSEDTYIIGAVYNLSPQEAIFDPPLKITLSYDPDELSQGVREGDVNIAYYEDGKWDTVRYKQVDTERHRVTTQINCFTTYAVLIPREQTTSTSKPEPDFTSTSLEQALSSGRPTLAEFGSVTCQPCKEMKPILEELAVEYAAKLNVVIIDIYEQRELANQYGIMAIPTQILFDSSGKEITRHIGFWAKDEIVTQLQEMRIY